MPRTQKKIVEDLDHAFELAFVLITVIAGILAQFVSTEQEVKLPPIIANMRRLSIGFIFPSILTIVSWIAIHFSDDETKRMHLRTYSWTSIIFLAILEVSELYVICRPESYPEWINFPLLFPFLLGMIFPLIPLLLTRRILNRYRIILRDIPFFTDRGKLGTLRRYMSFVLSYIVFWLSFTATIFV